MRSSSMRLATESSRSILLGLALILAGTSACESGDKRRVPPPAEWKPPDPKASGTGAAEGPAGDANNPRAGMGEAGDPHAGLDMSGAGDPHAGLDMSGAGDPHAGLDMGGAGDPHAGLGGDQDPHANLDMGGGDPAMAAMKPPDPDRPIDPNKFLRGTIRASKELESAVKPGSILFLSAWPIDPTTGDVLGSPVAVAKLTVEKLPMPFELSERDVMVAGTGFAGDVQITARVDADGEARTKEPGDVEGRLRARVPAKGLELVLDIALR